MSAPDAMPVPSSAVAFGDDANWSWEVPVKNTFINFDIPFLKPARAIRSATCPPSTFRRDVGNIWDQATQELCHCMAPRSPYSNLSISKVASTVCDSAASTPLAPQATETSDELSDGSIVPEVALKLEESGTKKENQKSTAKASAQPEKEESEGEGAISDVSTKESEGTLLTPTADEASQKWTSVLTKKKKLQNAKRAPVKEAEEEAPKTEVKKSTISVEKPSSAPTPRPEGKGKGLSHFQRIEVGIDDDNEFHVVRRLIGPKGKHMQDIVSACRGAKVWICGRGSRSWEDSEGPLVICVGASTAPSFDSAVGLVQELLTKVHEEHRRYYNRR